MASQLRIGPDSVPQLKLRMPQPKSAERKEGQSARSDSASVSSTAPTVSRRVQTLTGADDIGSVINELADFLAQDQPKASPVIELITQVRDRTGNQTDFDRRLRAAYETAISTLKEPQTPAQQSRLSELIDQLHSFEEQLRTPTADPDEQTLAAEGAKLMALQLSLALSRNKDLLIADSERRAQILSLID